MHKKQLEQQKIVADLMMDELESEFKKVIIEVQEKTNAVKC